MSIYIKGVEMPTSCEKCPCRTADSFGRLGCRATGYIPLRKANQDRPDFCPLIPVPEHGDLIERKTAYDSLLNGMVMTGYQSRALDCIAEYAVPTIIPAESEATE